jgi:hypothetical protein
MAQRGLLRGTPLRSLALLLSNRPDLVHESTLAPANIVTAGGGSGAMTPGGGAAAAGVSSSGLPPVPLLGMPAVSSGSSTLQPGLPGPQGSAGSTSSGLGPSPLGVLNPGVLGLPGVRVSTPGLGLGGSAGYTPLGSAKASGHGGFFNPVGSGGGAGDVLLIQWRENLAIMASNRTAADVEAILQLGDRLLAEQGQVRPDTGHTLQACEAVKQRVLRCSGFWNEQATMAILQRWQQRLTANALSACLLHLCDICNRRLLTLTSAVVRPLAVLLCQPNCCVAAGGRAHVLPCCWLPACAPRRRPSLPPRAARPEPPQRCWQARYGAAAATDEDGAV